MLVKGANYVGLNHLGGKEDEEKVKRLVDIAYEHNFNSIRVWGGAYYPPDYFYSYCR